MVLCGWWLIPALYGADSRPAYPALVILLVGYGFSGVFQWNRPLMLAFGKPSFPLVVAALAGAVELALIFWLVPVHGYLMMAAILSGYFIISIGITTWRGLKEIRLQSSANSNP